MKRNPQAQRGHSRDHRPDCKQVCIGLVVTREGCPLGYEVFPGNLHDSKTVRTIVENMEGRYGKADRIWVWDRGMQSADILPWMREGGRRYVVATPKSELKKHEEALRDPAGWKTIKKRNVEVKFATVKDPDSGDTLLLCRSEERRQKEAAIHKRFIQRIEASLKSLARRLEHGKKPEKISKVQRQIGRMLQRNQRAARFFDIRCEQDAGKSSRIAVTWSRNKEEEQRAVLSEGCYVLRTNIDKWKEENVWRVYIQLTQVESAFRVHKDQLEIRPIWHQKEDRTQAHILVCFLAFVLWKLLERWQSRAGLGNSPRTILEELGQIQCGDIMLPTLTGEKIRLRSVVNPERPQKIILQRLGIDLPRRMRIPEHLVSKM